MIRRLLVVEDFPEFDACFGGDTGGGGEVFGGGGEEVGSCFIAKHDLSGFLLAYALDGTEFGGICLFLMA